MGKDLTAEIFITERAMTNFPRVMGAFQKCFDATVVPEMPRLEPYQRALEWTFHYKYSKKNAYRRAPVVRRCFQLFGFFPSRENFLNGKKRFSVSKGSHTPDEEAFFVGFGRWPE